MMIINIKKIYKYHAIKYGNFIDIREYNDNHYTHENNINRDYSKQEGGHKRSDSLSRSRINLYRLVHGNIGQHGNYSPIFTTYTFADNITQIDIANHEFTLYIKRLQWHFKKKLQYITVPEIQQKREAKYKVGVWHFHTVFFNLPWIDAQLHEKIWGQGWCDIEIVHDINDVGSYLAKYLSKDIVDSRLYGKKTYYSSRGLNRPQDFFHKYEIDNILNVCNPILIGRYEGGNYTQLKYKLNNAIKI